jgi:hypothetical protein
MTSQPVAGHPGIRLRSWGGVNLYGFVGNNAIYGVDILGLSKLFPYGTNAVKYFEILKRFADSPLAKFLGIGSLLWSTWKCIDNVINVFSQRPECIVSEELRGEWREKMRGSFRSMIQDCTGALFGALGVAATGWLGGTAAWLGQILGDVISRNLEDQTIDDMLDLVPGPPVCLTLGCVSEDDDTHELAFIRYCPSCH